MEIREKVSLKDWTFWKIGGEADFFCTPQSVEEVREALEYAHARKLPVTILGGGTNVLVHDQGIEGLVIANKLLKGVTSEERDGRIHIEALAGSPKSELTKIFLKRRLAPALFLCGLPGDIGGGVVMNAGISERIEPREFFEIVDWVDVIHRETWELRRFQRSDIKWNYRHSEGWQPGVVVRVGVSWPLQADEDLPQKVKAATKSRLERQPLELPSCGSTFKNPIGHLSAGALIERSNLKGFRIGGAEVSTKHANFIVNRGGATAADVMQVISHVRSEVLKRFEVSLETEVKFLGRWP